MSRTTRSDPTRAVWEPFCKDGLTSYDRTRMGLGYECQPIIKQPGRWRRWVLGWDTLPKSYLYESFCGLKGRGFREPFRGAKARKACKKRRAKYIRHYMDKEINYQLFDEQ